MVSFRLNSININGSFKYKSNLNSTFVLPGNWIKIHSDKRNSGDLAKGNADGIFRNSGKTSARSTSCSFNGSYAPDWQLLSYVMTEEELLFSDVDK